MGEPITIEIFGCFLRSLVVQNSKHAVKNGLCGTRDSLHPYAVHIVLDSQKFTTSTTAQVGVSLQYLVPAWAGGLVHSSRSSPAARHLGFALLREGKASNLVPPTCHT